MLITQGAIAVKPDKSLSEHSLTYHHHSWSDEAPTNLPEDAWPPLQHHFNVIIQTIYSC